MSRIFIGHLFTHLRPLSSLFFHHPGRHVLQLFVWLSWLKVDLNSILCSYICRYTFWYIFMRAVWGGEDIHHELFSVYFTSDPSNINRINISQVLLTSPYAISFCFHQPRKIPVTSVLKLWAKCTANMPHIHRHGMFRIAVVYMKTVHLYRLGET